MSMCIIAIKPKKAKMFSDEEIKTMFFNNEDGAGFMYNKDGHVYMKKGYFKVDKLLKELHKINFDNCDLVLHFRISTSGKIDKNNCHPFKINDNLYFVHNGILSEYTDLKSDKSDTALFCDKVLKKIEASKIFSDKNVRFLVKELIGGGNKMCFLNSKGYTKIGDFIEDNGRFYSNNSYIESRYKYNYSYNDFFDNYKYWYDDKELPQVYREYTEKDYKYNYSDYMEHYNDYYYFAKDNDNVIQFYDDDEFDFFMDTLISCGDGLYVDEDGEYWKMNLETREAKLIDDDLEKEVK